MARSTAEVEYRVVATTVTELLWISYVLHDFGISCAGPIKLTCDNKFTLQMLKNPTHHEKTKHIDIDCDFARHHVASSFFVLNLFLQVSNSLTFLPNRWGLWSLPGCCSNLTCLFLMLSLRGDDKV